MAGKKAEWAEEEVPFCCESANDRWARSKFANSANLPLRCYHHSSALR